MAKVVIVGGGISGLACAFYLTRSDQYRKGNFEIVLVESSDRFGGIIQTVEQEGCLIESGPDSFITNKPQMLKLASDLGIADRIVCVNAKNRGAFVVNSGVMRPLPAGFVMLAPSSIKSFLASPLLSAAGKLRALLDLALPARRSDEEESLAQFVRRRFGDEVLDRLAQPLVAGIYVGNAEKLSANSVAARFVEMERTTGSVITALRSERLKAADTKLDSANAESGARYSLFASFDRGMQVVVDALVDALKMSGVDMRLSTKVVSVNKGDDGRFVINAGMGIEQLSADELVVATGPQAAARLTASLSSALSDTLAQIEAASSAVINFVFNRADVGHKLDAFGAVVPVAEMRKYKFSSLALSFASVKFERAPDDKVIVRAFVGGMSDKNILGSDDAKLIELVLGDLRRLIHLTGMPLYARVHRWSESMPQYEVGHSARVSLLEGDTSVTGLHLAGAYLHGVGLPDCVASGAGAASAVLGLS